MAGREPKRAGSQRPVAALHRLASLFDARRADFNLPLAIQQGRIF